MLTSNVGINNTVAIKLEQDRGFYRVATLMPRRRIGNKKTIWEAALPLQNKSEQPAIIGPDGTLNITPNYENVNRTFYQGGDDIKDLYATHNMNLVGVRNALKMGGLAMPSLAMRKVSQGNINQFGDIVFVANERLATPARGIEVYDRDAWTPNLSYAVRYDLTSKARDYIREVLDRVGQSISYTSYAYNIEENLMSPQSNTMAVE